MSNGESSASRQVGITLLEFIIASSILLILASVALPIFRYSVVRQKEFELRRDLRQMRDAIDRYKDYSDRGLIRVELGSEGYPPDLDTLVKGLNIGAGAEEKIRFLRRIPKDPVTGRAEWNLQSVQDDPDSTSWGGNNVYDVRSTSQADVLDGANAPIGRHQDSRSKLAISVFKPPPCVASINCESSGSSGNATPSQSTSNPNEKTH